MDSTWNNLGRVKYCLGFWAEKFIQHAQIFWFPFTLGELVKRSKVKLKAYLQGLQNVSEKLKEGPAQCISGIFEDRDGKMIFAYFGTRWTDEPKKFLFFQSLTLINSWFKIRISLVWQILNTCSNTLMGWWKLGKGRWTQKTIGIWWLNVSLGLLTMNFLRF